MGVSHATAEDLVRDLLELQRATRRVVKATEAHRELSVVQTNILTLLSCVPGRRAKDIVAQSTLGASGLSRHLATLEQLGLVTRAPDPEDGRAQIVSITDSGRQALDTNLRADAENLVSRLGDLSEEEAARASASLNRITELFLDSLGMSRMTSPPWSDRPRTPPNSAPRGTGCGEEHTP